MYEESRRLEADVAATRATVERLAVEQDHLRAEVLELRREFRAEIGRIDARLFQIQLAILGTFTAATGALVANLVA